MFRKFHTLSFLLGAGILQVQAQQERVPHIVLIMCDDMGFSDLGCYGSEIHTPHIDSLAEAGVRFSQFKNAGRSCPSRASLLTGRYQHTVDMGWMTAVDEHRPGYRGEITDSVPTIAEVMKAAGYRTCMSGKWHVTLEDHFGTPDGSYPTQRGFDQYYGCLSGGGSYYKPKPVYRNLTPITEFPDDYYYTTAITDSAVAFINRHPDSSQPLFLYVAHYAPHLPLHAPADRVEACLPRYEVGYDKLRRQRFERQKQLGLVADTEKLPVFQAEFGGKRPAWEELTDEQRRQWTHDMATYAAMIEIMDDGIGQLIEALRAKGMLEQTVFFFLSDNGATLEGGYLGRLMADLSNTPYRSYKQWTFQGGISTPFIVTKGSDLGRHTDGRICRQVAHITDVLPTCMDLGKASYPGDASQLPGISLLPFVEGKEPVDRTLFFEHQGSCAVIDGHWKLVRASRNQPWELHDLSTDPFELHDVAGKMPDKVKDLEARWNEWADRSHVFPLEDKPWTERIHYYRNLKP